MVKLYDEGAEEEVEEGEGAGEEGEEGEEGEGEGAGEEGEEGEGEGPLPPPPNKPLRIA